MSAKQVKKQSLVLISGQDVQLFINFLSNDPKLITTSSGPMASVPATLLSPVCFTGATLTPLKLKLNQSVYQDQKFFSLDILGPILPSTVNTLSDFFKTTQGGNYKLNLIASDSTAPFGSFDSLGKDWSSGTVFERTHSSQGAFAPAFATESLKDCGLATELVNEICLQSFSSKEMLNEITLKNNLYIIEK